MSDGCKVEFYAELAAEVVELFRGEVAAVVGEDAVWYAESTSDAFEELDCCGGELIFHGYSLDPLGKFIDCDQQVRVTAGCRFWQWTYLVESPLCERPCERYCHQVGGRSVWFGSEALAGVTLEY